MAVLSMSNYAVEGVQFRATALFSFERRRCSIHNGRGVQLRRRIHFYMREWDYKGIYLKDFLTKYTEIENKLLSAFDNSQNVFYTYQKVGEEMTSKMLRERLYKNKELCLSAIKEYEQPNYWDKCEVICRHIIGSLKDKPFSISLQINGNFENNYITEAGYLSKEESKILHTFDDMKIEVPLPFKEDDYVVEKHRYLAYRLNIEHMNLSFLKEVCI